MAISFPVDTVEPAAEPPATRRLAETVDAHLALGLDPNLPVVDTGPHPLIGAVHLAFADADGPIARTWVEAWATSCLAGCSKPR